MPCSRPPHRDTISYAFAQAIQRIDCGERERRFLANYPVLKFDTRYFSQLHKHQQSLMVRSSCRTYNSAVCCSLELPGKRTVSGQFECPPGDGGEWKSTFRTTVNWSVAGGNLEARPRSAMVWSWIQACLQRQNHAYKTGPA